MSRKLVIGNKNYSSWSLRPWLALKKAGIDFEEILVLLDKPDTKANILKHSAAGRVPVLIENDQPIWDSLSICEWAAEHAGHLWPSDPMARAHARSVSAEMHSGFSTLRGDLPMNIRATKTVDISSDLQGDIDRIVEIWAECREQYSAGGPWLFGAFSIADAMFAPVATRLRTYQVPVPQVISEYIDTLYTDPDFSAWHSAATAEEDILRIEEVGE